MNFTFIYYLHWENGIPFYVGKANTPKLREYHHRYSYGNISLRVVDQVSSDKKVWKFWECFYIEEFKN